MNKSKQDLKDLTNFLNEIDTIKNKYQYIDFFHLEERINNVLKKYTKRNSIFNILKCIHENNEISLIINVNHIQAEYMYKLLTTAYQSRCLLNRL